MIMNYPQMPKKLPKTAGTGDGDNGGGGDPVAGVDYHPPINFATVEERIYRSGFPKPSDFPFLETLNLRSVMWVYLIL